MHESVKIDCAALLAHADWVRALARHLVPDAHAAEDLAQDTLVAALVRPPPDDRPLRGWLAGVLRNLVRQSRREAGNRQARELAAARSEADAASAELLERLDVHRALVEAVARLDDPYRTVVLMRWFEGLAPAVIAARTGSPLRTVETRLHRALARLRAELDRTYGRRQAWLLALIPYARGSGGWSAAAVGALVMDAKLKLGVAALVLVGLCSTLVMWRSAAPSPAAAPMAREAAQHDPSEAERALASAPEVSERHALEAPAPVVASEPAPAPVPKLHGRVIDVERAPVAGVTVRFSGAELEARTDVRGAFELERPRVAGRFDVATPGWTSLFRPEVAAIPDERELVLVVARSLTIGGRVLDARGNGVEGAEVALPHPFGLRARFDAILDRSSTVEHATRSEAAGRFELADVPLVPGLELVTTHPAYLPDRRALPEHDELGLEIVLQPLDARPERIVGTVVDPAGDPVDGAWVAWGDASARSGPAGAFALELEEAGDAFRRGLPGTAPLRAAKAGYLPAEIEPPVGGEWPQPLVLRLGEPPLELAGRVVDSTGAPVPRAEVWVLGETRFGYIAIEGGEMSMRAGTSIEGILRGDPWARRTVTDADGRFELRGLLRRDYELQALDKQRLLAVVKSVPAGARDVELRLPDEELHALVAGRVTSLGGEPLEGLTICLERASGGTELDRLQSRTTKTDAAGRFRLEHVSRSATKICINGDELGLMGFERPLAPDEDVSSLEIKVPLRVHVQIDAGETSGFDRAALLDARGEPLTLSVHHGESSYAMSEIPLANGRSEPFSASELAETLVLYAAGVEKLRMPVELARGKLNTLRP